MNESDKAKVVDLVSRFDASKPVTREEFERLEKVVLKIADDLIKYMNTNNATQDHFLELGRVFQKRLNRLEEPF